MMTGDARKTVAGELSVVSTDETTVVQIGDAGTLAPLARVLAVQREKAVFRVGEFSMRNYSVFSRPAAPSIRPEPVAMRRIPAQPAIRIGRIRILAASSAVIIQIGSSRELAAEARIKHIRQLFRQAPEAAGKGQ